MLHRNAGYVITIAPFIALLQSACAAVPPAQPAPRENPAEIVLPPPNSFGNGLRVRAALIPFKRGTPHSHTRPATCTGCTVKVEIKSVGMTRDIVPLNGPKHFRIVAWIRNTDPTDTENVYRLKPETDYLMWVDSAPLSPDGTSRTIWGLVELPLATGALTRDTIGYVRRCPTAHPTPSTVSDADFKECEYSHAPARTAARTEVFSHALFDRAATPPGRNVFSAHKAWFDCGGYCCSGAYDLSTTVQQNSQLN
jgi:hypothetical protein